jgi:hypothetical protein
MAREDEQRLKDLLRNIETGDIPEDLPDPEEYDDMGGIKSLDRGAPSIKMASETGAEEFDLELMSVIREFKDKMQKGELDPGTTVDDYINDYLSRKRMMMEDKNRQMAMYGGRMQYADAGRAYEEVIDKDAEEEYYKAKAEQLDRKYNPQNYPESERNLSVEQIKKMLKKQEEEKAKKAKGGIAGVL